MQGEEYDKMPLLMVPIFSNNSKPVGVMRIVGKMSGGPFTENDARLAQSLANAIQETPGNLTHLLNILKAGSEIIQSSDFEEISYRFLTLLTHGQGIGINRAILFSYDFSTETLQGMFGIGPADKKEASTVGNSLRTIPTLKMCISESGKQIEIIKKSALTSIIYKIFSLDYDCELLSKIKNATMPNISYIQNAPDKLSKSIRKLVNTIDCKDPFWIIIPFTEEKRIVILCDNCYADRPVDDIQQDLLQTAGSIFVSGLVAFEKDALASRQRKDYWVQMASMAAHSLGNKLPFVYDSIREMVDNPAKPIDKNYLDKIQRRLSSAMLDIRLLRNLEMPIKRKERVHLSTLKNAFQHHLSNNSPIPFNNFKWEFNDHSDPELLIDSQRLLDSLDILTKNVYDLKLNNPTIAVGCFIKDRADLPLGIPEEQKTANQYVCFSLKDNGPGIPESIRKSLFQPFISTKESGWGMGLSFVARVLRIHQGFIIEEGFTDGACFSIFLPVPSQEELNICEQSRNIERRYYNNPPAFKEHNIASDIPIPPNGKPDIKPEGALSVLIVEDDEFITERLIRRFTHLRAKKPPYQCFVAKTLNDLITHQKKRETGFDIVILDLWLWDSLKGRERDKEGGILASSYSNIWNCGAVTIVFSAQPTLDSCIKAMRNGAWDCIDKNDPEAFQKLEKSIEEGWLAKFGESVSLFL